MAKAKKTSVDRRDFLKSATVGAAALAATPVAAANAVAGPKPAPAPRNAAAPLPPVSRRVEGEAAAAAANPDPKIEPITVDHPGSDFMVDAFKAVGFEYLCSNPGNSFRSLHESFINYGGNKNPEFITCCHEESAVGMAHGYFKIEGKPLLVCVHGTVGVQHASMAIYDAYCDRVPLVVVLGNFGDAQTRASFVNWTHSAQDPAALIRDFVKWDDQPATLQDFGESVMRAYRVAMTPPYMPVALVCNTDLQEFPMPDDPSLRIPAVTVDQPPQADSGSVGQAARWLVAAENPVIVADRAARTAAGLALMIELAEALQAAVVDRNGRMNFPTRHPLNQTERGGAVIGDADVILGLELTDFYGIVNAYYGDVYPRTRRLTKTGVKLISINSNDLYLKSNYQDFERYQAVDLAMAADAEATLPSLIEAVKKLTTADRKRAFQDRGTTLAAAHQRTLAENRGLAANGWDASPISTARLSAEIWNQIRNEDWSLVSNCQFVSRWPLRLWNFEKYYHYIGGEGGYGVGYGAPAAVGAALANRRHGRLTVSIQNDGDLMFAPGVLWTAAHSHIPLLIVMHNNRAYHQEVMEVQRMADVHERGITRAGIGTTLVEPAIDYGKLAQSMGMHGSAPVSDPQDLAPALREAIAVVKSGEPALVNVLTQPR
ncbi:MAG: twin-arginine translocation signal domain-containing protein [Acidobacteriota bacterium]|nr:twin-arginine translocation signal domain-containing protein [Acidobacteriota bacterium]